MAGRKQYIYCGPEYSKGLNVHGIKGRLDPASWPVDEAKRMVARYPQLRRLFDGVPEEGAAQDEEE